MSSDDKWRSNSAWRCCTGRLPACWCGGDGVKAFGSLFSCGGGADIGARAAGLELAWANELEPNIAEVYTANLGNHIRVGDILEEDPNDYEKVDVMHMSPPCTRASDANQSAEVNEDGLKESPLDIALANKCIEFISVLRPEVVTLENVWGYRKFQSWRGGKKCEGIQSALYRLGYWPVTVDHVNFANMGVPQTRKRMIVRAVRGGFVPYLPQPERWVGWYEAIEDILPTLPDSQFAPWQLERLPAEIKQTMMLWNMDQTARDVTVRYADQPVPTVDTGMMRRPSSVPQAVLVSNAKTEYSDGTRNSGDPAFTGNGESNGRVKAFLVGKNQDKYGDGLRWFAPPAQTIGANEHGSKAFIVDGKNSGNFGNGSTCLNGENRIFTIQASQAKGMPRACDGVGRVFAITPRALARFQSFPDWYALPESKTLAAKIIGNAVPPLGYQKIVEGLI